MRVTTSYDRRHPVLMAWARFVAGAWLVILTALLCSIGDWWGLVLLLAAGLLFWVGRRVLQSGQN
jgi:1,4-dihydroxy-2-naphthoate octaprenyltransferase